MPKSKKRNILDELSSFGSLSSISSESQFSSDSEEQLPRLSKKQLLELVKLEKKIAQEQEKLRMISASKSKHTKKKHKSKKKEQKHKRHKSNEILTNLMKDETLEETRQSCDQKLYLTGFPQNISYDVLRSEIKSLLAPFKNFCQYKLKVKKGESPYVFINFQSQELSLKVAEVLKNVKIVGKKVKVLTIRDSLNDQDPKRKCYECQETGHFGRQCPIRVEKQKNALKYFEETATAETQTRQHKAKQEEKQSEDFSRQQQKRGEKKGQQSQRVIREKSRLHKIIHDNF